LALIGGAQAVPFKANGEASGVDKLTACGQLISVDRRKIFRDSDIGSYIWKIFPCI